MEIRTERLVLRPALAGDLAALHAVLSDPRATAYWSTPPHGSLDETAAWLKGMMTIPAGLGEDFVVEFEGAVVGKAGLYRFPEVGYILHPAVWGQGIAGEALAPVLDRAFGVHGLYRVEADVDPRNAASLRLLGRLGFVEAARMPRTWRIGGQWCDSVYLHLARGDWPGRAGGSPI